MLHAEIISTEGFEQVNLKNVASMKDDGDNNYLAYKPPSPRHTQPNQNHHGQRLRGFFFGKKGKQM